MDILTQTTLITSVSLNILLTGLGINFIMKRGGLLYLSRKLSFGQPYKTRQNVMYDNPFYWDKKSHFETLSNSESAIVFLGDSLTDLCEWSEIFMNENIKNRGISGDTTDGVLNRISSIIESKPAKLFIMIGINDLNMGVSVENVVNNYQLILKSLVNNIPAEQVFIQSLLPINNQLRNNCINQRIVDLNAKIKELTQVFSFQYINLFPAFLDKYNQLDIQYTSDGVHLNGRGYLVWKELIEKYVVN